MNLLLQRISEFESAGGHLWLDGATVRFRYAAREWHQLHPIIQTLRRHRHEVARIIATRHNGSDTRGCAIKWLEYWQPSGRDWIQ